MGDNLVPNTVEWVHYPFKIHETVDALLFRLKDGFEMRFTDDIFAKRTVSTPVDTHRSMVEIEIDGEDGRIVSEIRKINRFETPADFYIPVADDARSFYESIHSSLISETLDDLIAKSVEVSKHVREHGFPEIQIPVTIASGHFENFESAAQRAEGHQRLPISRMKFGEQVPTQYPEEALAILRKYLTEEQLEAQASFYRAYFDSTPISRFRFIARAYEAVDQSIRQAIPLSLLKRCICLHAYFVTSGPWRKCWVRLGFDPSVDQENYRYQLIEMRSKRANFQIFERMEIEAEVCKNRGWYLVDECDPVDGFVSKALKNFIVYTIDNAGARDIDKRIDEVLDSDFEAFDI